MLKKIVFINFSPLSKLFEKKIDFSWYEEKGLVVEHLDCSRLYYNDKELNTYFDGNPSMRYQSRFTSIHRYRKTVIYYLEKLDTTDTVVFLINRDARHHVNDYWLLRVFRKIGVKYIVQKFENFPVTEQNNFYSRKAKRLGLLLYNPRIFFKKVHQKFLGYLFNKTNFYFAKPILCVGSGKEGRRAFSKISGDWDYLSVASPSIDWSNFLNRQVMEDKSSEKCVFIDEAIGYAPDAKLMGYHTSTDLDCYHSELRRLFSFIEDKLGLEVIIAASGKYDYKTNPFGRNIVYGKTLSLTEQATLVLGHSSTALYQSVVFKRKTVLIYSLGLSDVKKCSIYSFSNFLNLEVINISDETQLSNLICKEYENGDMHIVSELFLEDLNLAAYNHKEVILGELLTRFSK